MNKRVFAAVLWFYTGWYAWAMVAALVGISPAIGPLVGVAVAGVVVRRPARLGFGRVTAAPVRLGNELS